MTEGPEAEPVSKLAKEPKIGTAQIALAVSLCALMLSGLQSYFVYRHNRITVQPILDWRTDYADSDDEGYYVFALKLVNVGLGTAIVNRIRIGVDHASIGDMDKDTCDALAKRFSQARPTNLSIYERHECGTLGGHGDVLYLQKDEEFTVFSIRRNGTAAEAEWKDPREHLGVIADYESLYGVRSRLQ